MSLYVPTCPCLTLYLKSGDKMTSLEFLKNNFKYFFDNLNPLKPLNYYSLIFNTFLPTTKIDFNLKNFPQTPSSNFTFNFLSVILSKGMKISSALNCWLCNEYLEFCIPYFNAKNLFLWSLQTIFRRRLSTGLLATQNLLFLTINSLCVFKRSP